MKPDPGGPFPNAAPYLRETQLQRLTDQAAYRLIAVRQRRGVLDHSQADPLADGSPLLAGLTAASVHGLAHTRSRPGPPRIEVPILGLSGRAWSGN